MPSITYDGQSFQLESRRLWIVGGTIQYARLTRDQWAHRIRVAKLAGLNTITTSVVWARHEPRAGAFDFNGDNDLRHFVQLVHQAGMHCVLRLGPYVGGGFDFGGLPPWVLGLKDVRPRAVGSTFLEACSRFFGAVAKQVRDLQVTVPQHPGDTKGGPIILVQNEHQWTTGSEQRAAGYLGELNRYIHESGFDVPIINANNLWQGVEGEVDTWVGSDELLGFMRQLATVRPNQPRFVSLLQTGEQLAWGEPSPAPLEPEELQRRLVEVLAGAGQFNVEPFAGGTNFAFSGGRLPGGPARFATTDASCGAMLDAAGRPTALFEPLRTIATFASRFGRVLSHLDARHYAVGLHPGGPGAHDQPMKGGSRAKGAPVPCSHAVMHASGAQGSVAFVFAGSGLGKAPANLLLSNGTQLPVYLDGLPAAWCLFDTRLYGRSHLDHSNLSAFALVGRVFVCFGPPGTPGKLSINGAPIEVNVPTGAAPTIIEHENIVLVVANPSHLPRIQITDTEVLIGASDVTSADEPVAIDAKQPVTRIMGTGEVLIAKVGERHVVPGAKHPPAPAPEPVKKGKAAAKPAKASGKKGAPVPVKAPELPPLPTLPPVVAPMPARGAGKPIELSQWLGASTDDYADGTSARYASIAGPAELSTLGAPYGYGWYKLVMPGSLGRAQIAWPHAGDRLHMFLDGKASGVIGRGAGAEPSRGISLRKRDQTLVVLAENMGRVSGGSHMFDLKGCFGHAWDVAPTRGVSRATLAREEQLPLLPHAGFIPGTHDGEVTDAMRVTWTLTKRRGPVLVTLPSVGVRGLLIANGVTLGYIDDSGPGTVLLGDEQLGKGQATIQIALVGDAASMLKTLAESVTFQDATRPLTTDAQWAFAKWERPVESAFRPLRGHSHGKTPEWFRATFEAPTGNAPLVLSTSGLSKGQAYVNGRHIGRYFTTTADNAEVGPQTGLYIPSAALKPGEMNEVIVFDEHGHLPTKVRVLAKP